MSDGALRPVLSGLLRRSRVGTWKGPVSLGQARPSAASLVKQRLAGALKCRNHRFRIEGGVEPGVRPKGEKLLEGLTRFALAPERGQARSPVEQQSRQKRRPLSFEARPDALLLHLLERRECSGIGAEPEFVLRLLEELRQSRRQKG